MKAIRTAAALVAAGLVGCADDSEGGPSPSVWDDGDWRGPGVAADGGSAEGTAGTGGAGGEIRVAALNGMGQDAAAGPAPAPPSGGQALSDADLSADVVRSGTLRIDGLVTASGPGPLRMITAAEGDIVVTGTLRAADPGGPVLGLVLQAPRGTVYVSGTVQAANSDGTADGDAGGTMMLRGARIVVTGALLADGEDGAVSGGDGGKILLAASGPVHLAGHVSARGGSVRGGSEDSVRGGNGGVLEVVGAGEIAFSATAALRGGFAHTAGAGAMGGDGGQVRIDGFAVVRFSGAADLRGGGARAVTGAPAGGRGGRWSAGLQNTLDALEGVEGTLSASGGSGGAAGGAGGEIRLAAFQGNVTLAGALVADGGGSATAPGPGGTIAALCDVGGGILEVAGALRARGGSSSDSGRTSPGGAGGRVELEAASSSGALTLRAGASIVVDGGDSAGAAAAGEGGACEMVLADGAVRVAGEVRARGGAARGAGGIGGRGGFFGVRSDNDGDGVGGNITIEAGAEVDVSGGSGDTGGSARNDGGPGVGHIPDTRGFFAVVLDSDSISGRPVGAVIQNFGRIVARGGVRNGSGGDVMFHGAGPDGRRDPLPGNLDLAGDGTGAPGDFAAE